MISPRYAAPDYRDLRVAGPGRPAGASWGVFGEAFELGTLNFIPKDAVFRAMAEVREGAVFSLNWDFGLPDPHPDSTRSPPRRVQVGQGGPMRDDYIDRMHLQWSSQWDGLRHARLPQGFYNGVGADAVDDPQNETLGIQAWGRRGIVARGVLLDVERHLLDHGVDYRPDAAFAITADILQAVADAQDVEIRTGDILMIRTGWGAHYERLSHGERALIDDTLSQAGLAREESVLEWLWDHQVAAITSDNGGVEVMPVEGYPNIDIDNFYHLRLIGGLGFVLGESFFLDALATACHGDRRYACFFCAAPFNLRGGVGSPANALAIR